MSDQFGVSEEDLQAFIDQELDQKRAAEIAMLVTSDAALAGRIAAFRSDKSRLGQVYGTLAARPLPREWLEHIADRTSRRRLQFSRRYFSRQLVVAVAAGLLLMVGAWLAYQRMGGPNGDTIIAEALAARRDSIHPQQVFAAATLDAPETHRVLTTALAMNLNTPDLAKLGYRLASIRIYSGVPGGKAVELDYRNPQNRLFTLYLRHPSGPARVDLTERDGMRICIWQDDVLGTVMAGEMSAGEMARIASLAYSGLSL